MGWWVLRGKIYFQTLFDQCIAQILKINFITTILNQHLTNYHDLCHGFCHFISVYDQNFLETLTKLLDR